jgi:hypothetical protein
MGRESFQMKRSTKSKVFVIVLNSLLLAVFIMSAWCYKDVSEDAANGGDPLGLIFLSIVSMPSLIVLGIILVGFKIRLQIPLFNGLISFIGIVALYIPLIVNGTTPTGHDVIVHNYWTRVGMIGVGLGVALSLITVVTTVVVLLPKRKQDSKLKRIDGLDI